MKIIRPATKPPEFQIYRLPRYNTKLCIATKNQNLIIEKSSILYLKSDSNYCEIHKIDGSKIICSKTMKEISEKLNSSHFIKVHKSFIVNISKIVIVDNTFQTLTIHGGTQIPIARMRKNDIKDMLKKQFD